MTVTQPKNLVHKELLKIYEQDISVNGLHIKSAGAVAHGCQHFRTLTVTWAMEIVKIQIPTPLHRYSGPAGWGQQP